MRILARRAVLTAVAALVFAAPSLASAQEEDPAAVRVGAFNGVLLNTMKGGKSLGFSGRLQKFTSAVQTYFNLPIMTQFACGGAWSKMSDAEKQSVIAAFTRYTAASYAHNFDSFDGQSFNVDRKVFTRGPDKVVKTQILAPRDTPTNLSYRLREYGGSWRVIDVSYNAISQLTTQRSDFASSLSSGGAPALVAKLDQLTAKLK